MATEEVVVESAGVDVDRHTVSAPRFAPIATGGGGESNAISVEQHTQDGDLCEAVVAPLLQSRSERLNEVDDDDDDVRVLDHIPTETRSSSSRKRKKKPYSGSSVTETDQLSNSKPDPSFVCEICIEPRMSSDMFRIKGCSHVYCNECVTKYVTSKLGDNVTHVGCPVSGCGGVLELEHCSSILPPEVFDRWGKALCEALILEGERFYCPFRDCSALLMNDGGEAVRESECPNCRRLFCAQCRVPWHAGIECQQFQRLKEGERGREDIMLLKLAEKQLWRRCPKCRFYVQKIDGCALVRCRCGRQFYYG
ncbi:E3 ubiquitin-protein ligase RSL1-like [Syzygium oleosum]|uniref:E3 ubiquitin-protein ligase RSL1-like n=1 Tax=Syzygium oleosum TaxID=219896 RepID=UPI0024B92AE3|nr:E3 ubiquitin-protein ligase RSL1-like [Syzygium oleosum]